MSLNLREISFFLKIVESGSLSAAATALAISQPALSRALKRLESRLGTDLFIRSSAGMEPTPFGEAFLVHAQIVQADAHRMIEDLNQIKGLSRGTARVGVLPSASNYILLPVIEKVLRTAPDIQIQIIEGSSSRLVAELEFGNIDFGIASSMLARDNENIKIDDLLEEQLVVVCRAGHPLAARSPVDVAELLQIPWAVPEKGNAILQELRKLFTNSGLEPPGASISANSVHAMKLIVSTSDFLTLLPIMAVQAEIRSGLLEQVHLQRAVVVRQLCVLRRALRPLLPAASMMLSEIRRHARHLCAESKGSGSKIQSMEETTAPPLTRYMSMSRA